MGILISGFHYSQHTGNVGVSTTEPTRTLDVNGNVRLTNTTEKTENAAFEQLVAADSNGNVDIITFPAVAQSDLVNLEVKKNIYLGTKTENTKECSCGSITFRFNGNKAEFKLNDPEVFTVNSFTNFNLSYGIKRFINNNQPDTGNGPGYSYDNKTVSITNSNYGTWKTLDDTVFATTPNNIRTYTIVLPKLPNLYRLTFSIFNNTSSQNIYGLVCEKFYTENI